MKRSIIDISEIDNPSFETGSVWLVGAGPGDPGLLTLRAYRSLHQADIVIYDALVSKNILQLVPAGVVLEYAGKRGGKPSFKQRDIIQRLIECSKSGKRVLRLKGGDPFMFGRGGEEALALAAENIPFRLVPGITASVGGLAASGIPVTHRTTGHGVTFLTGHGAGGNIPDSLDWKAIAAGAPTLIFYMALAHLENVAKKLIENGLSASTPSAIVANGTLANQQVIEAPLGKLAKVAIKEKIEPPAILVIGNVVELRKVLDPDVSPEKRREAAHKLAKKFDKIA
tara:strand:+ start:94208 stop:95059 length:852 start_codon:yes stop_codon:yes gene_type:complete